MQTEIGYLRQLEEDLLEAAWRQSLGREPAEGRRFRVARRDGYRRRGWKVALVAASLIAFLGLAGVVGYFVAGREGDGPLRAQASPETPGERQRRPALTWAGEQGFAAGDLEARASLENQAAIPAPAAPKAVAVQAPIPELGENARVIKTAELSVVVEEDTFDEKWQAANDVATRYRGWVSNSTTRGDRAGEITVRVPAKNFEAALLDLRALGRVERETVRGKDVTAQYVDLHARLSIVKARRDVLLDLFEKANSIPDTIRIQNELDDVQLRIEELQGQLRFLNDKTRFATIAVAVREKGVEPEPVVENPSLGHAVDRSVAGFFGVLSTVTIGLGYLIPIAVLAAVLWFVVRLVRRRRAA